MGVQANFNMNTGKGKLASINDLSNLNLNLNI